MRERTLHTCWLRWGWTMSDRPPTPEDYVTIAAGWIHSACEKYIEDAWEWNPEIGQYDMDRIIFVMTAMLPTNTLGEKFNKAYARFEAAAKECNNE